MVDVEDNIVFEVEIIADQVRVRVRVRVSLTLTLARTLTLTQPCLATAACVVPSATDTWAVPPRGCDGGTWDDAAASVRLSYVGQPPAYAPRPSQETVAP